MLRGLLLLLRETAMLRGLLLEKLLQRELLLLLRELLLRETVLEHERLDRAAWSPPGGWRICFKMMIPSDRFGLQREAAFTGALRSMLAMLLRLGPHDHH